MDFNNRAMRVGSAWTCLRGSFPSRSPSVSYERLPRESSIKPQDIKKQGINCLSIVLVLFLVMATGVSAGLICRSSESVTEYPLLINATIEILTKGLAQKKFTNVDLVKAYLARIAEVNEILHAVNEVNPDALDIAVQLDLERSSGIIRSSLHGIPLLIKDTIATKDKMNNTAGSWALLGAKVPRDATVAQKLRDAGAILLGKTNLSQWAHFRSLNTTNGWSALGGQVYSPYFPYADPLGSSSGSAVASALGLALGCLGTETDGSIVSPSSYNNLVGIKPTVGLTSRHLVIPVSEHQDTVGPLARTVKDAAYILQAIAGVDPLDNCTSAIPDGVIPNYITACKLSALSGSRLGIPRDVISLLLDNTTGSIIEAFEYALDSLRAAGATIVDDANFTEAAEFENSTLSTEIIYADFVVNLQSHLESLTYNPKNITSLTDLRKFTQSCPLENYPMRDTGLWDQALQQNWNNTHPHPWPAYQKNLYHGGEGGLLGAIDRHNLDAVILPAKFASGWAAAVGAVIVTVPLGSYPAGTPIVQNSWGLIESALNIPFGISFLGAKFTEAKLIGLTYAFEQRTLSLYMKDCGDFYGQPNAYGVPAGDTTNGGDVELPKVCTWKRASSRQENGDDGAENGQVGPFVDLDETTRRLASGKILSHRTAKKLQVHRLVAQTKDEKVSYSRLEKGSPMDPSISTTMMTSSSKKELATAKRELTFTKQLASLRAENRRALAHLTLPQQRAGVAKAKRQQEKWNRERIGMEIKRQVKANP
ncbi:hypothetical protein BP5796_09967 [Coleophoma crateriformis]|uniref:Amidase domain-containing protein n=1 Tax=Coleophoma crateriformis TaxID=565419 RepID=A0A3D8QU23_9HELO|nr:hypothetical protein BP5796_09967 [Coleophoma crateriformis]